MTSRPGEGDYAIRLPKRYVYTAVLVLLTLAILESAQRVSDWRRRVRHRSEQGFHLETSTGVRLDDAPGPLVLTLDSTLGYRIAGGQSAAGVSINADGFRDRERARRKPDGVRRVVVLGGSAVFGFKMPDDAALFTRVLERRLGEAFGPERIEVLNAGVVGYTTTQEAMLLATRIADGSPDLVVLFDGWNDFWIGGNTPENRPLESPVFQQSEEAIVRGESLGRALLHSSALYRGLERRARRWSAARAPIGAGGASGSFHEHPEALSVYRRELTRACRIARGFGARVLLVPQPELFQRSGTIPPGETAVRQDQRPGYAEYARARYPAYVAAARDVAASEGADFLDGTRIFDATDDQMFVDYVHFNARGHALVAAALQPAIVEALRLKPSAAD